jgi:DNA-directed RNA polymerase subunit RPC12/RpoP
MKPIRCIYCGAIEGEPIEELVPVPSMRWEGDWQHVDFHREVVREVSFNSIENRDGETEYVCSECRQRFTFREIKESEVNK